MKFRIRYADQVVGFFLLVVLLGIAGVLVLVGINQRWFAKNYTYRSLFPSGDGLSVGMGIYLKGFQVGKVSAISLNDRNEVDLDFYIEDRYQEKVKPDSILDLATSAIGLGSTLRLLPGLNTQPPLPEGSFIPIRDSDAGRALVDAGKVDVPKGEDVIGSVIGKLNPILDDTRQAIAQIRRVVTSLDAAFQGRGGPVGTMVSDLSVLPGKVNATVDDITGRVDAILDRVDAVAKSLDEIAQKTSGVISQTGGVIGQASDVVGNLSGDLGDIAANLKAMTADLANTQGLVKRLLDPKGSIDTFLDDSNRLYDQVDTALKSANGVIAQIRGFVDFINGTRPQVSSILEKGSDTLSTAKDVLEAAKNNPLLKGGVPASAEQATPLNSYRDENF